MLNWLANVAVVTAIAVVSVAAAAAVFLLLLWFLHSYCYGLRLRSTPHTVLIKPNAVHNQHTHTAATAATATGMTIATALTWIRCVVHVQRLQDQRKRLL